MRRATTQGCLFLGCHLSSRPRCPTPFQCTERAPSWGTLSGTKAEQSQTTPVHGEGPSSGIALGHFGWAFPDHRMH